MTQEAEAAAVRSVTREAQVRHLEHLTEPVLQLLAIALVPSLLGLLLGDVIMAIDDARIQGPDS